MTDLFTNTQTLLQNRIIATIDLLKKVPEFAQSHSMSEEDVLNSRLAPDMFPLKKQIQTMSDNAKGFAARLNQIENPRWEDTEETVDELIGRLQKTLDFLEQNPVTDVQKAMKVQITFPWWPQGYLQATDYVIEYLIPNFLFHATIIYGILRNIGMEVGKTDYLRHLSFKQNMESHE